MSIVIFRVLAVNRGASTSLEVRAMNELAKSAGIHRWYFHTSTDPLDDTPVSPHIRRIPDELDRQPNQYLMLLSYPNTELRNLNMVDQQPCALQFISLADDLGTDLMLAEFGCARKAA